MGAWCSTPAPPWPRRPAATRRQLQPQTPSTEQTVDCVALVQHVQNKLADWHFNCSCLRRVFGAWRQTQKAFVAKRARDAARWLHRQVPELRAHLREQRAERELPAHYAALDVPRDADSALLTAAFRARALETHPDKRGGTAEAFRRVKSAFEAIQRARAQAAPQPQHHRRRRTARKRNKERKRQKRASRKRRKRTKRHGVRPGVGAHPDKWYLDVVYRYYKALSSAPPNRPPLPSCHRCTRGCDGFGLFCSMCTAVRDAVAQVERASSRPSAAHSSATPHPTCGKGAPTDATPSVGVTVGADSMARESAALRPARTSPRRGGGRPALSADACSAGHAADGSRSGARAVLTASFGAARCRRTCCSIDESPGGGADGHGTARGAADDNARGDALTDVGDGEGYAPCQDPGTECGFGSSASRRQGGGKRRERKKDLRGS